MTDLFAFHLEFDHQAQRLNMPFVEAHSLTVLDADTDPGLSQETEAKHHLAVWLHSTHHDAKSCVNVVLPLMLVCDLWWYDYLTLVHV